MKLKGEQFKQLRDALVDAFTFGTMRSMVRVQLDTNLDEIVSRDANFREQVEELIFWAERNERVEDLIIGARDANPGNLKLDAVQDAVPGSRTDAASRAAKPDAGEKIEGDHIVTGDFDHASAIAIGRGARVEVNYVTSENRILRDEQYETALNWAAKGRPPMRGFDLARRDLSAVGLTSADLAEANLAQANLYGANLTGSFLTNADLSGADLRKATLIQSSLIGSNLRAALLTGSILEWARLNLADLSGANLSGADLSNVDLREARYTGDTVWPEDFDPEAAGAILLDGAGNPQTGD